MFLNGIYFLAKLLFLQLYPAYVCYKAIKVNDQPQFGSLLTYWVVVTAFLTAECLADIVLFWLPFYIEFKFALLIWMILPQKKGTIVLYSYLDPWLTSHQDEIDKTLIEIQHAVKDSVIVFGKNGFRTLRKIILDVFFNKSEDTRATSTASQLSSEQAADSASSSTSRSGSGGGGGDSGDGHPYGMFMTLVNKGISLTKQQPPIEEVTGGTGNSSGDDNGKLERSDSYDSLASFVSGRKKTPSPRSEEQGWTGYFTGWMWKSKTE
ncbi:hypothetical protein EC973_006208 [Apophysomyces ossiformis]|uniref:Protein YOP1 n=1 Tax=Apophysomyces ossiformis TaxID=679940 RepID=A0A8H7BVJ1_9FUNG|nr:hypothetical protein EC973_006208 [Apophysomyces ossiformis]